ncbi:MAG: DUF4926 domain-containing protein [Thermodesulfobacteriota bacterium]|nr:DUF4926 domain-containing protein [Thermodesulfobacteriota bacterium]
MISSAGVSCPTPASSPDHRLSSILGERKEHDKVILTKSIEEYGLEPGDIGAVVYVYGEGEAFEVEFVTLDGITAAVLELESVSLLWWIRKHY